MELIDRGAASDALKNDMASLDHIIKGMSANDVRLDAYVSQRNQVNYDICTINSLPAAQPKKGKWKYISDGYVDIYECDQCGKTEDYERNFCPNCGADMRQREE